MQDLIMRVAPRLEQWILVHSTNRFYTGLHRNESDDYSNYLWASRMGCGWQIGRIAQDCGHTASYCPNPEILLFLVPLYIQVRRMAIAHQVTYDLNGEILREVKQKINQFKETVKDLSAGGSALTCLEHLESGIKRWIKRLQQITQEEMLKRERDHFARWNLEGQIENLLHAFPQFDAIGTVSNHFSECSKLGTRGAWTHQINAILQNAYKEFEHYLKPLGYDPEKNFTPHLRGPVSIEAGTTTALERPLLPFATCHGISGNGLRVPLHLPDRFLQSLKQSFSEQMNALFLGEVLGSWHFALSYKLESFVVTSYPEINDRTDGEKQPYALAPCYTFSGMKPLDFLIGQEVQLTLRIDGALHEPGKKQGNAVTTTTLVVRIPLRGSDLYLDDRNQTIYPYCIPLLIQRAIHEGSYDSITHQWLSERNLLLEVEQQKQVIREAIVKKAKSDDALGKENQVIQCIVAKLLSSMTFSDMPLIVLNWVKEVFSQPTTWLNSQKPGLCWISPTPSLPAMKELIGCTTWGSNAYQLAKTAITGIVDFRTESGIEPWIERQPERFREGREAIVSKLTAIQPLFEAVVLEAETFARFMALRPAPLSQREQTDALITQLTEQTRLLRRQGEQLIAMEENNRMLQERLQQREMDYMEEREAHRRILQEVAHRLGLNL